MNRRRTKPLKITLGLAVLSCIALLTGCGDDTDPLAGFRAPGLYGVTITNLTNNQPFSPVAAVLHRAGYKAWEVGGSATDGLERLAEGGQSELQLWGLALFLILQWVEVPNN